MGGSRQVATSFASLRARAATASSSSRRPQSAWANRSSSSIRTSARSAGSPRRRRRPLGGATSRSSSPTAASSAVLGARRQADSGLGRGLNGVQDEAAHGRDRDARSEPARCTLLQLVRLVEDNGVVLGQDAGAVGAVAQGQVGEVERVVRDHELGLAGLLACRLGEAARHARAAPAEAAVGADGQLRPQRRGRLLLQLGAIAGPRRLDPRQQALVGGLVAEQPDARELDRLDPPAAEVVLPALEHRDPHLPPERRRGEGHVLRQKLFLQRLGRGRHDDPAARVESGKEVAEALPGPRAGLREQVLLGGERASDGLRERELLRPVLVLGDDRRQAAECVHADRLFRASAVAHMIE